MSKLVFEAAIIYHIAHCVLQLGRKLELICFAGTIGIENIAVVILGILGTPFAVLDGQEVAEVIKLQDFLVAGYHIGDRSLIVGVCEAQLATFSCAVIFANVFHPVRLPGFGNRVAGDFYLIAAVIQHIR